MPNLTIELINIDCVITNLNFQPKKKEQCVPSSRAGASHPRLCVEKERKKRKPVLAERREVGALELPPFAVGPTGV